MPNFETFTKRLAPLAKAPFVTIQKRGTISLTASAHAALGSPEAVELLYAPDEKIVGFRAVDAHTEHAYPLRAANNGNSFVMSGRAFTQYYGIPTAVSTRYPAYLEDDVLCIDLGKGGTEVSSNRQRRRTSAESPGD